MITGKELSSTKTQAFQVTKDFNDLMDTVKDQLKKMESVDLKMHEMAINRDGVPEVTYMYNYICMNDKLREVLKILLKEYV